MARGRPDYSNPFYAAGHPYNDPAWLSLSVAGVASMDGAGRPVFMSDFRDGIGQWAFNESSLGYTIQLTPGSAYAGLLSCRLITAGTADDQSATARKYLVCPASARIGGEIAYKCYSTAPVIYLQILQDDGTNNYYGRVKLDHATGIAQIETPTGYVTIADWSAFGSINAWDQLKLVVDFEAGTYVRLLFASLSYNLEAYALAGDVPPTPSKISVAFKIEQVEAVSVQANLGLCIITTDEP